MVQPATCIGWIALRHVCSLGSRVLAASDSWHVWKTICSHHLVLWSRVGRARSTVQPAAVSLRLDKLAGHTSLSTQDARKPSAEALQQLLYRLLCLMMQ